MNAPSQNSHHTPHTHTHTRTINTPFLVFSRYMLHSLLDGMEARQTILERRGGKEMKSANNAPMAMEVYVTVRQRHE